MTGASGGRIAIMAALEPLDSECPKPNVELKVIDTHLNDDVFAGACCQELLANIEKETRSHA